MSKLNEVQAYSKNNDYLTFKTDVESVKYYDEEGNEVKTLKDKIAELEEKISNITIVSGSGYVGLNITYLATKLNSKPLSTDKGWQSEAPVLTTGAPYLWKKTITTLTNGSTKTTIELCGSLGQDGTDIEYVFRLTKSILTDTLLTSEYVMGSMYTVWEASSTYQTAEYCPTDKDGNEWSDNPSEALSTNGYTYLYYSVRKRKNGTWGMFSEPKLWSSVGLQGLPGEAAGAILELSNDNTSIQFNGSDSGAKPYNIKGELLPENSTTELTSTRVELKYNNEALKINNITISAGDGDSCSLSRTVDINSSKIHELSNCAFTFEWGDESCKITLVAAKVTNALRLLTIRVSGKADLADISQTALNTWSLTEAYPGKDGNVTSYELQFSATSFTSDADGHNPYPSSLNVWAVKKVNGIILEDYVSLSNDLYIEVLIEDTTKSSSDTTVSEKKYCTWKSGTVNTLETETLVSILHYVKFTLYLIIDGATTIADGPETLTKSHSASETLTIEFDYTNLSIFQVDSAGSAINTISGWSLPFSIYLGNTALSASEFIDDKYDTDSGTLTALTDSNIDENVTIYLDGNNIGNDSELDSTKANISIKGDKFYVNIPADILNTYCFGISNGLRNNILKIEVQYQTSAREYLAIPGTYIINKVVLGTSGYTITSTNDSILLDDDSIDSATIKEASQGEIVVYGDSGKVTEGLTYKVKTEALKELPLTVNSDGSFYFTSNKTTGTWTKGFYNAVVDVALHGKEIGSCTIGVKISNFSAGETYKVIVAPNSILYNQDLTAVSEDKPAIYVQEISKNSITSPNVTILTEGINTVDGNIYLGLKNCSTNKYVNLVKEGTEYFYGNAGEKLSLPYSQKGYDVEVIIGNNKASDVEHIDCPTSGASNSVTIDNDNVFIDNDCASAQDLKSLSITEFTFYQQGVDITDKDGVVLGCETQSLFMKKDSATGKTFLVIPVVDGQTGYLAFADENGNILADDDVSNYVKGDLNSDGACLLDGSYSVIYTATYDGQTYKKRQSIRIKEIGTAAGYKLICTPNSISYNSEGKSLILGANPIIPIIKIINNGTFDTVSSDLYQLAAEATIEECRKKVNLSGTWFITCTPLNSADPKPSLLYPPDHGFTIQDYAASGYNVNLYKGGIGDTYLIDSEHIDCVKNGAAGSSGYALTVDNDTITLDDNSIYLSLLVKLGGSCTLFKGDTEISSNVEFEIDPSNLPDGLLPSIEDGKYYLDLDEQYIKGSGSEQHYEGTTWPEGSEYYFIIKATYDNSITVTRRINLIVRNFSQGEVYNLLVNPNLLVYTNGESTNSSISIKVLQIDSRGKLGYAPTIYDYAGEVTHDENLLYVGMYAGDVEHFLTINKDGSATQENVAYLSSGYDIKLYKGDVLLDIEHIDCISNASPVYDILVSNDSILLDDLSKNATVESVGATTVFVKYDGKALTENLSVEPDASKSNLGANTKENDKYLLGDSNLQVIPTINGSEITFQLSLREEQTGNDNPKQINTGNSDKITYNYVYNIKHGTTIIKLLVVQILVMSSISSDGSVPMFDIVPPSYSSQSGNATASITLKLAGAKSSSSITFSEKEYSVAIVNSGGTIILNKDYSYSKPTYTPTISWEQSKTGVYALLYYNGSPLSRQYIGYNLVLDVGDKNNPTLQVEGAYTLNLPDSTSFDEDTNVSATISLKISSVPGGCTVKIKFPSLYTSNAGQTYDYEFESTNFTWELPREYAFWSGSKSKNINPDNGPTYYINSENTDYYLSWLSCDSIIVSLYKEDGTRVDSVTIRRTATDGYYFLADKDGFMSCYSNSGYYSLITLTNTNITAEVTTYLSDAGIEIKADDDGKATSVTLYGDKVQIKADKNDTDNIALFSGKKISALYLDVAGASLTESAMYAQSYMILDIPDCWGEVYPKRGYGPFDVTGNTKILWGKKEEDDEGTDRVCYINTDGLKYKLNGYSVGEHARVECTDNHSIDDIFTGTVTTAVLLYEEFLKSGYTEGSIGHQVFYGGITPKFKIDFTSGNVLGWQGNFKYLVTHSAYATANSIVNPDSDLIFIGNKNSVGDYLPTEEKNYTKNTISIPTPTFELLGKVLHFIVKEYTDSAGEYIWYQIETAYVTNSIHFDTTLVPSANDGLITILPDKNKLFILKVGGIKEFQMICTDVSLESSEDTAPDPRWVVYGVLSF